MIVPASITFGQAGKVHYLEQVENWDVFVSCSLGHTVGFNKLMLASVSSLFKRVLLDLGESDNVHISTNFSIDELKYLHELCHYGTVEHGQASLIGTTLLRISSTCRTHNETLTKQCLQTIVEMSLFSICKSIPIKLTPINLRSEKGQLKKFCINLSRRLGST